MQRCYYNVMRLKGDSKEDALRKMKEKGLLVS